MRILFVVIFLAVWLPSLMFTASNASFAPPLQKSDSWVGPYKWKFKERDVFMMGIKPELLLRGQISTKNGWKPVVLRADFIEWLYASGRHKVKSGGVYRTGLEDYPFVTDWEVEHDQGLGYRIGGLRFNGIFLFGLFFCFALPVLFLFWLMADDVAIDSPQERKQKHIAFIEKVKEVEARAKAEPKWLKRKTIGLAFLGYIVVLGSILLMIPVGIGLGAMVVVLTGGNAGAAKLAFVLAAVPIGFAWHMGRSLLSESFAYTGIEVTAQDCPALFTLLQKICDKANGPMFKRVFIDNEMNASVTRSGGIFGFFGMGPVVLTLGLPLMQAQTQKQLAGVIGHEYGHVAARDNALGHWVYRIRNSWLVLDDKLRFEHLWYVLKLNRFYEWFMSTFSAHSFALSRQCEYEADAFSARVAGKEAMAEALSSLVVYGDQYDSAFWKKIWDRSDAGEEVKAVRPYAEIPAFFKNIGDVSEGVQAALKVKTGYTSTHPSVSDRLAALGQPFQLPEAPGDQSAAKLLGAVEEKLIGYYSQEWQAAAQENWLQRQEERRHWQERYAALKEKPLADLDDEALRELISATSYLEENELFYAASQEMLRRVPDNAGAEMNCLWYRLTIARDAAALAEAEAFLTRHPSFLPHVCRDAITFLKKEGREEEVKSYQDRLEDWEHLRNAAAEERDTVLPTDAFLPHDMPEEEVKKLTAYFAEHPVVSHVYLARKDVKYMPEYPCYIIGFKIKPAFFASQKKTDEQVGRFIYESNLPDSFVFIQADSVQGIEGKLKKTAGANIYKK